ncbi:MAG: ligand-binding sensor domain-containing protein [Bacteroidia bacterium]
MNRIIRKTLLLTFSLIIISCIGQVKESKKSAQAEKISAVNKIPIPKNGFWSAHLDNDGSLWFSSNGGGIYHYDGKIVKNYTEENGLNSNQVYSIASDSKNNLWFGTQKGLTKFNRQHFEHITLPYQDTTKGWISTVYPVLNPNAAYSLATDNNDNIWIGTAGGGAYKYDGNNFKPYLTEIGTKYDGFCHNWVHDIEKDAEGNMWFASMSHGGVSQFNGDKFTHFKISDGLSDDMVRTIYNDRSGKIWIGFKGSENSGLTVFDGKSFKKYSVKDGLHNTRIFAIYEDKSGKVWLGGNTGKLYIFDGQNFTEFSSNGQTYSDIVFILGDFEDNVWFGGSNGIWKFDGESVINMTI